MEIPKTWEEVAKVGKYILTQEREQYNNTLLIGFNGLLTSKNFKFFIILYFILFLIIKIIK